MRGDAVSLAPNMNLRSFAILGSLGCLACETHHDVTADVVRMDRDGVDLRVHAYPFASVSRGDMSLGTAAESGELDLHLPMEAVHEYEGQTWVELYADRDGIVFSDRGHGRIDLPMSVAAALAGGGHIASVALTPVAGPDGYSVFAVTGEYGDGGGWFATDGLFEVAFRAPIGTLVTSGGSSVAVDATGAAVLRLWLPEHLRELHHASELDAFSVRVSIASPGLEAGGGVLEIAMRPGRALRQAIPHVNATRSLFGAATTPPVPGARLFVDPDDSIVSSPYDAALVDAPAIVLATDVGPATPCAYTTEYGMPVTVSYYGNGVALFAQDTRTGAALGSTTLASPRTGCPESIPETLRVITDRPDRASIEQSAFALVPR